MIVESVVITNELYPARYKAETITWLWSSMGWLLQGPQLSLIFGNIFPTELILWPYLFLEFFFFFFNLPGVVVMVRNHFPVKLIPFHFNAISLVYLSWKKSCLNFKPRWMKEECHSSYLFRWWCLDHHCSFAFVIRNLV